jgi:hypothetical protein
MVLTGLRERLGLLEQLKKVTNKQTTSTKGKTDFFIIFFIDPPKIKHKNKRLLNFRFSIEYEYYLCFKI